MGDKRLEVIENRMTATCWKGNSRLLTLIIGLQCVCVGDE